MEVLIALILGWLVVTAVVGVAVRHVVHRRDRRRRAGFLPHPVCARCGYSVYRLTHHRCPECGADLRVSGVEHAGRR